MICTAAGAYAERRYRRGTGTHASWEGDHERLEEIDYFVRCYPRGYRDHYAYAVRSACRFIREPKVWAKVEAVADVLMRDGIIEGDHSLLRDIEGWRPLRPLPPALTRKSPRIIASKASPRPARPPPHA
jgi:hypothetical protein